MSTGALATLLSQQPFSFTGLKTIGKVAFILDLVLFLTFCILISIRFILEPRALSKSLHHPHESFFFGTFWVSITLILYCIQSYGVPSTGPWLVKTLEVCFWLYAGCVLLVVILPAYPFLVLGRLAAVLECSQPQTSAISIMVGGIVFQGLGWMTAFIMYTIYFTRLINSDLPEESKRPGMYVAVGPAAYTSNTLVALGVQAPKVLPATFLGITSVPTGDLWKAFAVPAGMFLWLLDFWFFALATVSVLWGYKKLHFTLNYWPFIFPNVGLTVALIQTWNVLDSDGTKGVCSAMTVALVIAWIGVAVMNVRAVWRGDVLWPGMDEDMEDMEGHGQKTRPD
ncbi:hypothetical protein LTS18_013662 [Coniosporium uncinatum]|uniref:Uncharacterized protein n=1 Tax=Coniosporium uncinatum TaxID=93489 RepID=A0ACC3DC85_9PEZI|nr:hypothetical protein LTS18_013662 [Coniosporium uncinatum]